MATSQRAKRTGQLALGLLDAPRDKAKHGGARPGAGRPRKKDADRAFIAHRARPSHRKGDPVHVTLRVKRRVPSLRRQAAAAVVKRALLAQRKQLEKKEATSFQIVHFTIQDDHVHLVVEATDKRAIARGVAGIEIRIARRLNALLGRKGALWAERYHRRDLRTPTETRNVLRYVLLNFQKHHRIIGEGAFADPYSSAASFDGFGRPPFVFHEEADPWRAVRPHTWLLRVGWKSHGLLDPSDAPSSRGTARNVT